MSFTWKEIVPSDYYCLQMADKVGSLELIYITQLYQPLIGPLSVSLYMTFFHEYSMELRESSMGTHRGLMSTMGTPLDSIIKARENLEAVGLLKTVKVEKDEGNSYYEYVLLSPLSPSRFFSDDMLSIILLNRIGKSKYRELREKLLGQKKDDDTQVKRKDVTKSFDQVFKAITPSELTITPGSETDLFLQEVEGLYPTTSHPHASEKDEDVVKLSTIEPDFSFLEAALPKTWIKNRKLSNSLRAVIKEIAFFYLLDDMQLSYFLQDPYIYGEDNEIQPDKLRFLVKEWYQREHQGDPLVRRIAPAEKPSLQVTHQSLSKQDAHKMALTTVSPVTLLEHYQEGSKVSSADLKIVEELAGTYLLPPGVINALLEYVMLTNNKKLPRSLIFKIAGHWKRLKIETVEQALEQAKQLYQEAKHTADRQVQRKETTSPPRKGSASKKEILPDWVTRQNSSSSSKQTLDDEQKRQARELLRALGELDS